MINLSKKQSEVINEVRDSIKGDIVLYKEGAYYTGKSYIIPLIPLATEYKEVLVVTSHPYQLLRRAQEQYSACGLRFEVSKHGQCIVGHNFRISFTNNIENVRGFNGLVVIENPHKFNRDAVSYVLSRRVTKLIIENPDDCGWRNPLIRKGEHVRDEDGNLYYSEISWDYNLLEWEDEGYRSLDYKDHVSVVVGDGVTVNKFI